MFLPDEEGLDLLIFHADIYHPRYMGPSDPDDPADDDLTPSQQAVKDALTAEGWDSFCKLVKSAKPSKRGVRVAVRLTKIIWYVSVRRSITIAKAESLNRFGPNVTTADLKLLASGTHPLLREIRQPQRARVFRKIAERFVH